MALLPAGFVKNWLWPTILALVGALISSANLLLPELMPDGLAADDWPRFVGVMAVTALGFVGNLWSRYGGKNEPFVSPEKPA